MITTRCNRAVVREGLHKKADKNRSFLLTFLYHLEVAFDNNGSEKAIRNAR